MSEAPAHRLAVMTGLALAAATALWWLGSTRLALDRGADASHYADDALYALLLVRITVLALVAVRVSASRGWRGGVTTGLGMTAPSWPVAALAWSASTRSLTYVALTEVLLLAGSIALPVVGSGLRHLLRKSELAVLAATLLGTLLVALAWVVWAIWRLPSI